MIFDWTHSNKAHSVVQLDLNGVGRWIRNNKKMIIKKEK